MASAYLDRIGTQIRYDRTKSPVENLNSFYTAVKMLRYEWAEIKVGEKSQYYLDSAWQSEIGLRDITIAFQQAFTAHLVELSMSDTVDEDYMKLLKDCKEVLRKANHYFNISFTDILIIDRPLEIQKTPLIIHFEGLSDDLKESITRCYDLIVVFFRHLEECVNDEIKEYERKEYVRDKSTYVWIGDKNELSEICLALFLSSKIKRRDGKEIKQNAFARELAAFLGTDKLNFDQDIASLMTQIHGSQTEFIDLLQGKIKEYYSQRLDNQG